MSTVEISLDHLTSLMEKLDTTSRLESQYFTEYEQRKKKTRSIDFIITSEHVDDDDEIDDIDSIDLDKMMKSKRGVTLTVMHTDTIVGYVKHMEKTTIGEVAKQYPDSADRLNIPTNEHVKCIIGKGELYDDTPELDDLTWQLIKMGKKEPKQGLSAVSLRGVGHTHANSKVCDPEKKCGKQVTKTKFWSVTLCPDGEQAKPYSVILRDSIDEKIKMKDKEDSDCGGTKTEFNELTSKLSQFETQLQELKTKMADKNDSDKKEEEMEKMDCPKCNEKMSYKKGASSAKCKACGEEHSMEKKKMEDEDKKDEKEKMSQVKMVQIPEAWLNDLVEADKELQQIKQKEKLSPAAQYLQEKYGTHAVYSTGNVGQTKMTTGNINLNSQQEKPLTPVQLQKMIREEAKKLIKESPDELGLSKIRTPETGGDGAKGAKRSEEDEDGNPKDDGVTLPSFEQAQDYLIKTRGQKNFDYTDILDLVQGKVKMKQEA